jgi:hypothetical protein
MVDAVITAQRNVAMVQGHGVNVHAAYVKALIQYGQATGTLLEWNGKKEHRNVRGRRWERSTCTEDVGLSDK